MYTQTLITGQIAITDHNQIYLITAATMHSSTTLLALAPHRWSIPMCVSLTFIELFISMIILVMLCKFLAVCLPTLIFLWESTRVWTQPNSSCLDNEKQKRKRKIFWKGCRQRRIICHKSKPKTWLTQMILTFPFNPSSTFSLKPMRSFFYIYLKEQADCTCSNQLVSWRISSVKEIN